MEETEVGMLFFADDIKVLSTSRLGIERSGEQIVNRITTAGLECSITKFQLLSEASESITIQSTKITSKRIAHVLGIELDYAGRTDGEVRRRTGKAKAAFTRHAHIWKNTELPLRGRLMFYRALIWSTWLYGCEL